jgi:hypothetical protein
VVRERLQARGRLDAERPASFEAIADLVGSVDRLPAGLSARWKEHLKKMGYGQERAR